MAIDLDALSGKLTPANGAQWAEVLPRLGSPLQHTRQYDVKLRAVWDPNAQVVKLIVTSGKGGYLGLVTCEEIWKKIDPIMRSVIG